MDKKTLDRAKEIDKEIKELEDFIMFAEVVWRGRIVKQDTRYIFRSNAYGAVKERELKLNTELKNKVLNVLREHLAELERQFSEM